MRLPTKKSKKPPQIEEVSEFASPIPKHKAMINVNEPEDTQQLTTIRFTKQKIPAIKKKMSKVSNV